MKLAKRKGAERAQRRKRLAFRVRYLLHHNLSRMAARFWGAALGVESRRREW